MALAAEDLHMYGEVPSEEVHGVSESTKEKLVGSPEWRPFASSAGNLNQEFRGVARRLLRNLNRGWSTPDPCDSDSSETALGGWAAGRPRCLNRGWVTPDPVSMSNESMPVTGALELVEVFRAVKQVQRFQAASNQSEQEDEQVAVKRRSSLNSCSTEALSVDGCADQRSISTWATSSANWRIPSGVLIFFDWDDTIFPTSWLESKLGFAEWSRGLVGPESVLDDADRRLLDELDHAARSFLVAASQFGKLCCVTLAKQPWQFRTMSTFLPRLAAAWEELGVRLRYASQEKIDTRRAEQPFHCPAWCLRAEKADEKEYSVLQYQKMVTKKQRAMDRELRKFYGGSHSWKHVISFGDGPYERQALQDLAFEHVNPSSKKSGVSKVLRTKTVKMLEAPDCQQLCEELRLLQAWLPSIICVDGDFDTSLDGDEDDLMEAQQRLQESVENSLASEFR
jgi:hypothetical protein